MIITTKEPRVAIIVLNWNNWWDTLDCLSSLEKQKYTNRVIWIIDNGSSNDSRERIIGWLHDNKLTALCINEREINAEAGILKALAGQRISENRIVAIFFDENAGYAGGNNKAIKCASTLGFNYFWILNNDTRVLEDSLFELVKSAEGDKQIGMVVSNLINDIKANGEENKYAFYQDKQEEIEALAGGSILIRNECLDDIGLIDEKYFCYGEELDWSLRAKKRGWKLVRSYRSVVFHKWGSSTLSKRIKKKFLWKKAVRISWPGYKIPGYYESRNGIYFIKKNKPHLWILYSLIRTGHLILQLGLYDDHKWDRIQIVIKGAWDGICGRMGKADITLQI